ncbi:probable oligoribonuclease [Leptopilina heterotoma]|uniref:probable oligoribonuclease n=1 Tax=Leptopilina heterotoma TaxID=63436 RepID=UPI001CA8BBFB|nr:probable oligoribonuclease [Leptopilina heterotoma]
MTLEKRDYIVWMDLEMSGLDPVNDKILEVACLITDGNLKKVSDEFHIIIHQSDEVLNGMDEWCTEHHEKTGLTNASRNSTVTNSDAESRLLKFLQKNIPQRTCPLAGNSVYMDRMFLTMHMPLVNEYLHYRIIDVSTVKELVRRWNPSVFKNTPRKKLCHRALDDIIESIQELEYYRKFIF